MGTGSRHASASSHSLADDMKLPMLLNTWEAVRVELRHRSEVRCEDFTVTGLQCCNEEIDGLFSSFVDFF